MQVNTSGNYQNFSGRFINAAVNHLRKNSHHYIVNTATFTSGALLGNIKSVENVLATKVLLDGVETVAAIIRNRRTSNGLANFNNPLSNTMIWLGKGTWKLLEKVFGKI